MRRTPMT